MMGKERNSDAPNILHLIKQGTIGAEIGVWMANTSAEFQKKKLKELYKERRRLLKLLRDAEHKQK